ncbi:hypothetical protein GKE82_04660 [Conexibacter sp. W3-3-2]|uniref:Uncharacterized protein n=1 Tax=Paraconexibacter algicola TaxID=2133960 RepID=A0A2T4UDG7_9ACTN|nr:MULTISPECIES: hypothetical protein [Solirubrobacterales]MTD43612.1 hypothetical protein [Conexibacter sp. W3-3-2]PTL55544.1 hypothetical protein C7Y72_18025 [Paraconexibacter algicola]
MNSRNPRMRPRPVSDAQHGLLVSLHGDADVSGVQPLIMEFYERAVAGEPVTPREVQRIIDAFKEHRRPDTELPLTPKQLWWIEKRSGEEAAEAAEQLTRDHFPRLVLEALAAEYGTADVDEILELPLEQVKAWSLHLVGGASLLFGGSQRDRQTTLIKAAATAHDLAAPMKRLHKDVAGAAARNAPPADDEA